MLDLVQRALAAHAQWAGPGRAAGVGDNDSKLEHSLAVYQAQGMVTVQADCTFPEALVKMTACAQAAGQTLEEIAQAVVERRIRFKSSVPEDRDR
jgi:ANTAR domain